MYDPHRFVYSKTKNAKPPKVRFKPGQYVQRKSDKQLFEIKLVYRVEEDIHEWKYILEERDNLERVDTVLSLTLESLQSKMGKSLPHNERIVQKPVRDHYAAYDLIGNDYSHGDRTIESNKDMLNKYELISSGAIS